MPRGNGTPPPQISVVIPTAGERTALLRRAIATSLQGPFSDVTEVIVVGNGARGRLDDLRSALAQDDHRVRLIYVPEADQNVARNQGFAHSCGKVVRFLDDDDFLFPDEASAQYSAILEDGFDVCSGAVALEDETGARLDCLVQPAAATFVEAALHHCRLQIPLAHAYRREAIQGLTWPVGIPQSEDNIWLLRCASHGDVRWKRLDATVGVWYQHPAPRMSSAQPTSRAFEYTVEAIIESSQSLMKQGRWSPRLARITSNALWQCVHKAFHLRPLYWSRIATVAKSLDTAGRPDYAVYSHPAICHIDPVLLQWLLLPKRSLLHAVRTFKGHLFGWDHRRQL